MKGIIKYNGKLYKRAKNKTDVKKGDIIQLICKRGSSYFAYNGVYEVVRDPYLIGRPGDPDARMSGAEIHIPIELTGRSYPLCLKMGYNVGHSEWFKLVENPRSNKPSTVNKDELQKFLDKQETINIKFQAGLKLEDELPPPSEFINDSEWMPSLPGDYEPDTIEFDELDEDEGSGSYCCGKRMVERGVTYTCLKCGNWEYSSS